MEKDIVNKLFTRVEMIFSKPKLNVIKTIYFNFRTMPVGVAVKLPVFIYGKVQFAKLQGNVVFRNCEVRRGMVKFGQCVDMFYPKGRSLMMIDNNAELIFEGACFFNTRYTIRITGNASLIIGENVRVGSNVRICCQQEIRIGANTDIAYNCEMMDSNFHYILNREDRTVCRYTAPISIGSSNWIGNNSQIMKGTKTKDNTMVAARSYLNKNYIAIYSESEYITLAGVPAVLKSKGHQRLFSKSEENEILRFFISNPTVDKFNYHKNQR